MCKAKKIRFLLLRVMEMQRIYEVTTTPVLEGATLERECSNNKRIKYEMFNPLI